MLVLIIALPIEVSSAQNNQDPNLVEITHELNELVYRVTFIVSVPETFIINKKGLSYDTIWICMPKHRT